MVSVYASAIYDESRVPMKVLNSVPSLWYNDEVIYCACFCASSTCFYFLGQQIYSTDSHDGCSNDWVEFLPCYSKFID